MGKELCKPLQGIRFVCFLAIFFYHCGFKAFSLGWGAVEVFFVISGFFTFQKLSRSNVSYGMIIKKRVSRLFSDYLPILAVVALMYTVYKRSFLLTDTAAYALGLQNFFWLITRQPGLAGIMAHTWTIGIELDALLLICLLAFLCGKTRRHVPVILTAVSLAYILTVPFITNDVFAYSLSPIPHLFAFGIGGLFYEYRHHKVSDKVFAVCPYIGIALIAYMAITVGLEGIASASPDALLGSRYVCLIYPALAFIGVGLLRFSYHPARRKISSRLAAALSSKYLVWLGGLSFALYLCHYPVITVCRVLISNAYIMAAVSLALTMLSAMIYTRIINVIKRRFKKTPPSP